MSNAPMAGQADRASATMPDQTCARYPVAELFCTLQGEGANAGTAATFIRLGGCGNGCPWCDSPEAQTTRGCRWMTAAEIAAEADAHGVATAVITGGEPLLHDLTQLTRELHDNNIRTLLETSGTHPLSGTFDWICLSPKSFAPPVDELFAAADELKVVIADRSGFDYAEQCAARTTAKCRLYLQPEWNSREKVTPEIVDYIKRHTAWRLSLQTHKFIDIP